MQVIDKTVCQAISLPESRFVCVCVCEYVREGGREGGRLSYK